MSTIPAPKFFDSLFFFFFLFCFVFVFVSKTLLLTLSLFGIIRELKTKATATETKTSLKNITSFYLCYFASFNSSNFYKSGNYSGNKLVGVAFELRKKMKNSPPCTHVLHKTLNVVISRCCFAEDSKEMY